MSTKATAGQAFSIMVSTSLLRLGIFEMYYNYFFFLFISFLILYYLLVEEVKGVWAGLVLIGGGKEKEDGY